MNQLKPANQHAGQNVGRALKFIESRSQPQILALVLFLLAGIATVDYITGYEVHFFLFYYGPVTLLAWRVSLRSALVMAVVSAVVWYCVDTLLRPNAAPFSFAIWNGSIRLAAFFILAVTVSYLRRAQHELRHMNDQLLESLARLEASMAEAERLRNTVQTVCVWTKRINDEGKWISFEQFMNKHYGLQFHARNFRRNRPGIDAAKEGRPCKVTRPRGLLAQNRTMYSVQCHSLFSHTAARVKKVARGFALGLAVNFFPTFGFGVLISDFSARLFGGNTGGGIRPRLDAHGSSGRCLSI